MPVLVALPYLAAGLAEFFIAAYMGQQQHASWAQSLFASLGDDEIQHVGAKEQSVQCRSKHVYSCLKHASDCATAHMQALCGYHR
jgi:hypothetical protein